MVNEKTSLKQVFIRSKIKFSLIVATLLIFVGAVLALSGMAVERYQASLFSDSTGRYTADIRSVSVDTLPETIQIGHDFGSIVIKRGEGSLPIVKYDANKSTMKNIDGTLAIEPLPRENKPSGYRWYRAINGFKIGRSSEPEILTLTLPKDYDGRVEVYNTFGDISITGLDASQLEAINDNGAINITDATISGDIFVKADFGNARLDKINALGNMTVDCQNGNMRLEHANADKMALSNKFGDIHIEDAQTGICTVSSNNGRIDVNTLEAQAITSENGFGHSRFSHINAQRLEADSSNGKIEIKNTVADSYIRAVCSFGSIEASAVSSRSMLLFSHSGSVKCSISGNKSQFTGIYKVNDIDSIESVEEGSTLIYGSQFGSAEVKFDS